MPLNIVLYQPEIAPNTVNITRLCVALSARLHLIKPLGFILDDKNLKRAGLDYWQHLECVMHSSADDFFDAVHDADMFFLSSKCERPYTQARYSDNSYLIFGPETRGLPSELLQQHAESCYTIPMWGKTRSLNLANSVAIVAYEAMRQLKNF